MRNALGQLGVSQMHGTQRFGPMGMPRQVGRYPTVVITRASNQLGAAPDDIGVAQRDGIEGARINTYAFAPPICHYRSLSTI